MHMSSGTRSYRGKSPSFLLFLTSQMNRHNAYSRFSWVNVSLFLRSVPTISLSTSIFFQPHTMPIIVTFYCPFNLSLSPLLEIQGHHLAYLLIRNRVKCTCPTSIAMSQAVHCTPLQAVSHAEKFKFQTKYFWKISLFPDRAQHMNKFPWKKINIQQETSEIKFHLYNFLPNILIVNLNVTCTPWLLIILFCSNCALFCSDLLCPEPSNVDHCNQNISL